MDKNVRKVYDQTGNRGNLVKIVEVQRSHQIRLLVIRLEDEQGRSRATYIDLDNNLDLNATEISCEAREASASSELGVSGGKDSIGTLKCRVGMKTNMEHAVAMQITGAVLVLVAAMKNRDPWVQSDFWRHMRCGQGPAASMRMLIGGGFGGIGAINLYCSFTVETQQPRKQSL